MEEFELIAKTFMGLEPVLAQELTELGANNVQIGRRMVSFTGNKEMMYRANFQLHTAIRILKPIAHFKAQSAEDMYEEVRKIDWSKYIGEGKTFSVDSVVYSNEFRNSRFVTYKVKDAIVDQFREETGKRPNISVTNPDIRLNIPIAEFDATLALDSSGESLHRRGDDWRGDRRDDRRAPGKRWSDRGGRDRRDDRRDGFRGDKRGQGDYRKQSNNKYFSDNED